MSDIMDDQTGLGTGTWRKAHESVPTYVKVVIPRGMLSGVKVDVITSETNGRGAGDRTVTEKVVHKTRSMTMPPGAYYINGLIRANPKSVPVTILTKTENPF